MPLRRKLKYFSTFFLIIVKFFTPDPCIAQPKNCTMIKTLHFVKRSFIFSIVLFCLFISASLAIQPVATDVRNFPIQNISGRSQILPLLGIDSDGTIVSFTIKSLPSTSSGTLYRNGLVLTNNTILTPAEAQLLQFDVKSTFTGDAFFTFTVTDNEGLIDSTPASFTIPIVAPNQNLVCTGGGLGTNILGANGTFSSPFIVAASANSCINNGSTISSPTQNLGRSHPELTDYDYANSSGGLGPEGTYTFLKIIGTMSSFNCIKGDWVAKDHTGDGGYFMVVNGSPDSTQFGKTFYQAENQQVCPNTLYEFSAYVINVLPGNSSAAGPGSEPNISFYINGTKVSESGRIAYSTAATSWEPQWVKVGGLWYSGQNTTVDLRIDNATFVASGNDLGLDDISLAICGPDITYPDVDLSPKFCAPGILPLNALVKSSINTYSSYVFERSTDGGTTWQLISTPKTGSPVYDSPSNTYSYLAVYGDIPVDVSMNGYKYRLKVATNEANLSGTSCNIWADKVITVSSFSKPNAGIDITGCNPSTSAQLAATLPGETWSAAPGNPAPASINSSGLINGMTVNGLYRFILTNTADCTDTVAVTRDQVSSAGLDTNLCSGATSYKLNDAPAGYSWEIVSGNPTNADINASTGDITGMTVTGTYRFQLRSVYGGCTDEVSITVPVPLSMITNATNVRCSTDMNGAITVAGQNGYPPYQYKIDNEPYQNNGDFNNLPAGTFSITVKDVNNCIFSQPVIISVEDLLPPTFNDELPGDTTVQCKAIPAAMTLTAVDNYGTPAISFTEVRSNGSCPDNYTLTRTWIATDECGLSITHKQIITVSDTIPPEFSLEEKNFCVELIIDGIIDEPTIDLGTERPEWYILRSGSSSLDLTAFSDNCTPVPDLILRWRIDFANGTFLTGNGQLSDYGTDIRFEGDDDSTVTHHLTYWVTDLCGNETEHQNDIKIHPRPGIIKQI